MSLLNDAELGTQVELIPRGADANVESDVGELELRCDMPDLSVFEVHSSNRVTPLRKPNNSNLLSGQFNQPNDLVVGPDGNIYVADGHDAQGMTTANAIAEGLKRGATSRISKFSPDGKFIKSWGGIGVRHGEFRTPHALVFDARGRLWVADRGNHRIEIFDQNGTYLESRYMFGRPSGLFIKGDMVYVIDSESGPYNHTNWRDGVRIGPVDEDRVTGFIPPFERDDRVYQGTAGEGVAVDADGNVYAAEGPNSITQAGGAFTKYSVRR